MNSLKFLSVLAFIVVSIDFGKCSPVAVELSTPEEAHNQLRLLPPLICFESPDSLKPCNFGGSVTSIKRRRCAEHSSDLLATTESTEASSDLPETTEISTTGNPEDVLLPEWSSYIKESPLIGGPDENSTTVVYRIKGCLPSGLPSNLPICQPEDVDRMKKNVVVYSLLPFGDTSYSQVGSDAPPVFPELDIEEWKAQMTANVETQQIGIGQDGQNGDDGQSGEDGQDSHSGQDGKDGDDGQDGQGGWAG